MPTFKHIVAATDFSETSRAAVALARDLSCETGATLTVVHVCEVQGLSRGGPLPYDELAPVAARAQARIEELIASLRRACPGATALVKLGAPAEQILAVAADVRADLIVLGTHGRHGLAHAVLGSVAEKVVRAAPVPVLTVRSLASS
jgi:nucleotide-binding universal stress UspA family protein